MTDISQEVRTALTAIKGFVSTLLISGETFSDEEEKEILQLIDRECDHLTRVLRRTEIVDMEGELAEQKALIKDLEDKARARLVEVEGQIEAVAGMTAEQAQQHLIDKAEASARVQIAKRLRVLESDANEEAEKKAKQALLNSIQRLSAEYTIEATTSVIQLPSEDMKGKLIGREGRNIRTFEQVTGVDLIIDDQPNVVVVSAFDPVRREVARITLMNLMLDGRIHPARIEELHEKAKEEIDRIVRESGEDAADRAGIVGISKATLQTLGRLRFRTSYAQNVLDHSVEVAELSALLAHEIGCNVEVARRAGLLHDIGKALSPEWEGPHAIAGMNYLKEQGEIDAVTLAVGAHHREIDPSTPEAQIVIVADSVSGSRPGARRESLDQFVKRVAKLEEIANAFPGVERSYAMQAGREIRLIAKPNEIDDEGADRLAKEVAKKIESDLQYPGQIKVTVIREIRAQSVAK